MNDDNFTLPNVQGTSAQPDPLQPRQATMQESLSAAQQPVVHSIAQQAMPTNTMVADEMYGMSAEDVDLIEKAWVEKAKAIVRATEGDPFKQSRELSKVKAEYIKKRFSRDMKVAE